MDRIAAQSCPTGAAVLNDRPSVFLVAGNRLLRETLAKLLVKRGDFHLCGVSPYIPDIARSIVASGTDVLILDSVTARLSECAFVSEILGKFPDIKVVLIDMNEDPEIFLDCVRVGAVGYFLQDASAAEVVSVVCLNGRARRLPLPNFL